jgi:hypothetical protein
MITPADWATIIISALALCVAIWTAVYAHKQVGLARKEYHLNQENPHAAPLAFEVNGESLFLVNQKPWPIYDVRVAGPFAGVGKPRDEPRLVADQIGAHSKKRLPILILPDSHLTPLHVTWRREPDGEQSQWDSAATKPN